MRKIFTFLCAALMSVGMSWAAKPTIQLYGNFFGEWADTEAFVAHETGPSSYHYADFSLLLEPGTYEFGLKVDGVLRADGYAYTRDNRSNVIEEGNTNYMTITTDVKGYYRFIWKYSASQLNADVYPNICGIYWKDVTDGQFEVTLGQESEVTIPKLWSTNSNFITNIANGVDQVRLVSTDETVATIEYTLANDGLGTITFHSAGECNIYAVHDVTQLYAYDSCTFHVTVKPASTPDPETPEEVLLTTITVSNSEVNYTVADMVDIDQSAATLGENGWTSGTVVVSAKAGYTITKIEYLLSAGMFGVGGSDTEAPFEITIGSGKTLTKIEVYGYESGSSEPQGETTTVTWNSSTLSSIYLHDGQSFTQDGVTVTSLDGLIDGELGDWMGGSRDASFKFSTSLGNFTKIEITGTIYMLGGSGWTQTSPGAVWTGDANETTFGMDFENVSQIVFTIAEPEPEPQPTGVENVQSDKVQATKILRNGMLFIEKDGKIYNATGAEVK